MEPTKRPAPAIELVLCLTSLFLVSCTPQDTDKQALESDPNRPPPLFLDSHIDIPDRLASEEDPSANPGVDGPMQVDLPKLLHGGIQSGFFIVYVAQGPVSEEGYQQAYAAAERKWQAIDRFLTAYANSAARVTSPDELEAAVEQGKFAVAIGIENAYSLGRNFEHLDEFYRRGARYISLTHFGHNDFGSSSVAKGNFGDIEEPDHEGLSQTGRELITAMNRLGIMVDVSHTSIESTLDAAEVSRAPVIASHSGVKALSDHPRNLTDREIKAIAETGGVIQVVAFDQYMRPVSEEEQNARLAIRAQLGLDASDWYVHATETQKRALRDAYAKLDSQWPRATVETLVDQIDYVVRLVGIDHVGISSDFGGGGGVKGWDHAGETPALLSALRNRGYSPDDIERITSANLLRVWRQVESLAE